MDDEEEILAEGPASSRALLFSQSIAIGLHVVERYGWLLLLGVMLGYYVWRRWIAPQVQAISKRKQDIEHKKFDESVDAAHRRRVEEAREQAQQRYSLDAQRRQEREEEKRREKIEQDFQQIQGHKTGESLAKDEKRRPPSDARGDAASFIRNLINAKPVVVFSKSWCPYCRKAKQALSVYRLSPEMYEVVELDELPDSDATALQRALTDLTGATTVPRVFIAGRCIGGGDETQSAQRSGQLELLLREAGAIL